MVSSDIWTFYRFSKRSTLDKRGLSKRGTYSESAITAAATKLTADFTPADNQSWFPALCVGSHP